MTPDLKIALITDVHHGPAFEVKAGPLANGILASLLADIERCGADLLIDLGDRINNDTVNEDRANMRLGLSFTSARRKPRSRSMGRTRGASRSRCIRSGTERCGVRASQREAVAQPDQIWRTFAA